ncbi:hypothetical protein [Streptomyces sp. NPDC052012]|uniref:hypothetical protein n=1 Tax=Streptomyces sp. NPDC052012 TaxID=3155051 RepID=UPI00344B789F
MTVPEENRPKTTATDDTTEQRHAERNRDQGAGGTSRTLREALEEAQVRPDDFEDR